MMVSEEESDVYEKMEKCNHVMLMEDICEICGQHIDTIYSLRLGYIPKDYTVSIEERDQLRAFRLKNMMEKKKLYLILDLDHTLVHSVSPYQLTPDELQLLNETDSRQDSDLFKLEWVGMVTKLRPFVRTLLEGVSDMYEMYIYTKGTLAYAYNIAKLLDPERKYFGRRVISRDVCADEHEKTLDMVLAAENAVVIIDDSQTVWTKHTQNLIVINKYFYFEDGGFSGVTPASVREDGSETDVALVVILKLLQLTHQMFFAGDADEDFKGRDVRKVMKRAWKERCCPERRVRTKTIQAEEDIPL